MVNETDLHTKEIGKFYLLAIEYSDKLGNQKLQKIIGKDLFYKRDNSWWWDNSKIISMTINELRNLIKLIK
jgi:hypothetical protein